MLTRVTASMDIVLSSHTPVVVSIVQCTHWMADASNGRVHVDEIEPTEPLRNHCSDGSGRGEREEPATHKHRGGSRGERGADARRKRGGARGGGQHAPGSERARYTERWSGTCELSGIEGAHGVVRQPAGCIVFRS